MSEPGLEGDRPLNIGKPGRPEDATPGGQTQGNADVGERGTIRGGSVGAGSAEREEEGEDAA